MAVIGMGNQGGLEGKSHMKHGYKQFGVRKVF